MSVLDAPIKIAVERCTGCGRCVAACPGRLFALEVVGHRKYAAIIAPERCDLCLRCLAACPVAALRHDEP